MTLSHEQEHALDLFKEGKSLLITGPGGGGKTHLIQEFIKDAGRRGKSVQVCALTGCASLLLGCSAKTIHSWSGIKMAKGAKKQIVERALRGKKTKKNWKGIHILIIDEVSMMSKKIFEALEELARLTRLNPEPFGGLQVILTGDFFQLPPIGTPNEPDTSAFCFESPLWHTVIPLDNHIELNTMFRQRDPKYIEILSQVRRGELNEENTRILREHSKRVYDVERNNGINISKLFPIRARADYINQVMFDKLDSTEQEYNIDKIYSCGVYLESGTSIEPAVQEVCDNMTTTERDYEMNGLLSSAQCSEQLKLKIGALVMCTANLDMEHGICNGSQGIIIDLVGQDKSPKIRFVNGIVMVMSKHHWQSVDYPSIAIKQYPLQFAWALTIHKIQGASLNMAQMDVGTSIFEYGQTYVAMSRVKTLEGLYMSDFNPNKIRANPKVIQFYNKIPEIEYVEADDEECDEAGDGECDNVENPNTKIINDFSQYSYGSSTHTPKVIKISGEEDESKNCVVCLETVKSVLLLPCRHMCLCKECSQSNMITNCPLCRLKISKKINVYA
jgi:ATP-dependent DNA helicase PIF1